MPLRWPRKLSEDLEKAGGFLDRPDPLCKSRLSVRPRFLSLSPQHSGLEIWSVRGFSFAAPRPRGLVAGVCGVRMKEASSPPRAPLTLWLELAVAGCRGAEIHSYLPLAQSDRSAMWRHARAQARARTGARRGGTDCPWCLLFLGSLGGLGVLYGPVPKEAQRRRSNSPAAQPLSLHSLTRLSGYGVMHGELGKRGEPALAGGCADSCAHSRLYHGIDYQGRICGLEGPEGVPGKPGAQTNPKRLSASTLRPCGLRPLLAFFLS